MVRDRLKDGAYTFLYWLTRHQRKGLRVILMYHSVGQHATMSVSVRRFEEHLSYLKDHFRVVPLRALSKSMREVGQDNLACLSFDDGYLDNYELALPLLEKHGLKATFFVVSGLMGCEFKSSWGWHQVMSLEQIQELHQMGHEIGAHTLTHPKLTQVPLETVWAEISRSKDELEQVLGAPVVSFAYPKGDYNEAVKAVVCEAGFQLAVTNREGLVPSVPDWLALPRVWINDTMSMGQFRGKLSPAVALYERLRGRT